MQIDFIVYLADGFVGSLKLTCHEAGDSIRDWIGYSTNLAAQVAEFALAFGTDVHGY
jgi:hypothetical protein